MPCVLITGASSGIGFELAKLFARESFELVLVARNQEALNNLATELFLRYQTKTTVLTVDLGKHSAAQEIIESLSQLNISVDILVNNAGFGTSGSFATTSLDDELNMLIVNNSTLVALTKLLIPFMINRGYGRIVNVASIAGYQPGPFMAVYAATKAFVLSFSQAINEELSGSGVTVTAICPGPTETAFSSRSGLNSTKIFNGFFPVMTAKMVAEKSYNALIKGKRVYIVGKYNRLIVALCSLLPKKINLRFVRYLQGE